MKKKRHLSLIGLSLFMLLPLSAASLDSIMVQAKNNSSSMQLIELSKKNSDLAIQRSELETTLGVSVDGRMSYSEMNWGPQGSPNILYSLIASPSVSLALPNDGNTKITLSVPQLTMAVSDSSYFRANPKVALAHTFAFGDSGQDLDDLKLSRQKLEIEQSYHQRVLDFENSVYAKIIEIVNLEKSLLTNEKDLLTQQTKVDNAATLRTTESGSLADQTMQLELRRFTQAKEITLLKLQMAKQQYTQLTGLQWDSVESIKEANLEFTPLIGGDTTVVLASLDVAIATEELALKKRAVVSGSGGSTVPSLTVGGEGGFSYDQKSSSTSYSTTGSIRYAAKNFSADAQVDLSISAGGKVTPTLTIGGSWNNNRSLASDQLATSGLENSVTIANINYQEALLNYQIKSQQLQADLLKFSADKQQFASLDDYRTSSLQKTLEAFEKGLVTQTDVDKARYEVELSRYENIALAINALLLENRAKALQL
ncbi:MAG: hypothetical protein ACOXZ4_02440 [Sphaerochaetaceae bacterium]